MVDVIVNYKTYNEHHFESLIVETIRIEPDAFYKIQMTS